MVIFFGILFIFICHYYLYIMWIWDHQVCEYTMDFLDVAKELSKLK